MYVCAFLLPPFFALRVRREERLTVHKGKGFENLGGIFTSPVTSVSQGSNRLDLFGLGTNSAAFHKSYNGVKWSGWNDLGGVFNSPLVAESWGPNSLDVFGLGTDNGMYHKHVSPAFPLVLLRLSKHI